MKIGVIGVGNMGKKHIRVLSEIPQIEQVVICDVSDKDSSSLKRKFNVKFYTDFKKMIAEEKPDAVTICVPTFFHFKVAKYCLEKKVHVFIEKPIAQSVSQGKKLISISKRNKRFLMVGHIERFNPAVRKVKEMVNSGEIGQVIAIIARRLGGFPPQITDANIAVDLAIHDIDICNMLLDEIPRKISVNTQRNHIKNREDSVEFFLKYKKASAYIQANWISPIKIRVLTITGTEGYLEMDYVTQKIEFFKSNYKKFKNTIGDFSDFILRFSNPDKIVISVDEKEPLKEELTHFISCIQNNKKINSDHALQALIIASKAK